jgi:hypothetical protein
MYNSSKGINCMNRILRNTISMEKYLLNLPEKYWKLFCKFRTGNAKFSHRDKKMERLTKRK